MPQMDERYDDLVNLCYQCVLDQGACRPLLERLVASAGHFW